MTRGRSSSGRAVSAGSAAWSSARCGTPAILLADEPTGNLADSKSSEALMQMFAELHADGATLCIVTHDPRWLARAQRRLYLFDGRRVDRPADT
jgi:putative ABC transport system ATP-binding protein